MVQWYVDANVSSSVVTFAINGSIVAQIDYFRECDKFEKGLGVILRNAWQHVEVQQTTDVHAVVEHIGAVLAANLQQSALVHDLLRNNDIYQRQEMLVFQYLHDLLKNVEEIRESRYADHCSRCVLVPPLTDCRITQIDAHRSGEPNLHEDDPQFDGIRDGNHPEAQTFGRHCVGLPR